VFTGSKRSHTVTVGTTYSYILRKPHSCPRAVAMAPGKDPVDL
jgi:hypothetical protein